MSTQGLCDFAIKEFDKLTSVCKDKHAFIRHCCSFVVSELKKDSSLDHLSPEERANMIFYPLKIAAETREELFVIPALRVIQLMLAHGVLDCSFVYKAPDVPQLPKQKKFFSFGNGGSETPPSQTPKNEKEDNVPLVQVVLGIICMNATIPSEELQMLVVRALLTAVSTSRCEIHGSSLLLCIRTACDVFLQAKALPTQTSAKAALSQMIGTVQQKLEGEEEIAESRQLDRADDDEDDAHTTTSDNTNDGGDKDGISFESVNERDCFLVLRSLCKLSSRPIPDGAAIESIEMRNKTLSLTLLYNLVSNMGPVFASRPSCSMAIHKYLCVSLLNNFTSSSAEVTKISANILLQLLLEHRHKLKSKIGVFFANVLFPILESPNSSFAHRSAVLTLLEKVLSDGQAVTDIFVNFDCALSTVNLYHQILLRVAKVVQISHTTPNWITPAQDGALKLQGAQAVSAHVVALRKWIAAQQEANKERQQQDAEASGRGDSNSREDDQDGSPGGTSKAGDFERMLKGKKSFETLLEVFNTKKAKEGIALALKMGVITEETPKAIAQFLVTKGLDKVRVGEYLAHNNAHAKECLKEFILLNDFSGLEIDEAMRVFLGKFKILGEAEVVDRTMELFAERYCEQNPDAFSSPGTAYILSFSIMMLNTDAHSKHVKSKMTITEFIRNNKGIDDGRDLPDATMENIYHRITTREIKLDSENGAAPAQDSSPSKPSSSGNNVSASLNADGTRRETETIFTSLEKKKQMSYKTETEQLKQQSMMLLTADADELTEFQVASGIEVAAAMWEASWTAILPALSVPMEESEDEAMIDCCLEGFDNAMTINCTFKLATERKAFISSLLAFTHLTSFREIYYKNVKSIMTLITVACREGNSLEGSWYEILRCISWLEKLHLLSDSQSTKDLSSTTRRDSISQRAAELKKVELHNAEIIAQNIDQVLVDRIFSRSGELEGRAVVDLVEALCHVSAEELQEQPRPRTYSLQKLVEVAEINIGRLRYVWSQMWQHLSKHFISVGLDKQQLVAMFVVDSLRQLAMKFLQRDELGNFNFQRDFLKPFEVIAAQTKRSEIHELIIASLGQMIDARARNIMSGWKIVLNTLGRCGNDMNRGVVLSAAAVLEKLTIHQISLLATPELMTELVNAWSMFGSNTVDSSLSLKAVRYIRLFAFYASRGIPVDVVVSHFTPVDGSGDVATIEALLNHITAEVDLGSLVVIRSADGSSSYDFKLWLTILAACSSLSGVADMDIRFAAVEALFGVLRQYGGLFGANDWQMILGGTVFPIFENLLCDLSLFSGESSSGDLGKTQRSMQLRLLESSMRNSLGLVVQFYAILEPQLQELLDAFVSCARRADEEVIRLGYTMVAEMMQTLSDAGLPQDDLWDTLGRSLSSHMEQLKEEIEDGTERPASMDVEVTQTVRIAFTSLLALCELCGKMVSGGKAPASVVGTLTTFIRVAFDLCTRVLDGAGNRLDQDLGITLLACEEAACESYLDCAAGGLLEDDDERIFFFDSMQAVLRRTLASHAAIEGPTAEEYNMLALVAVSVIEFTTRTTEDVRKGLLDITYGTLCELITLCNPAISKALAQLLVKARQ
jgi:Sec7-like guanine-nucleotide exchange factor